MKDQNCYTCKFEPAWTHQSKTLVYNHTALYGRCKLFEELALPPCCQIESMCLVIPDDPKQKTRFGMIKMGSLYYCDECKRWELSEEYLEPLESEEDENHVSV